jgi:hypothetical protein
MRVGGGWRGAVMLVFWGNLQEQVADLTTHGAILKVLNQNRRKIERVMNAADRGLHETLKH